MKIGRDDNQLADQSPVAHDELERRVAERTAGLSGTVGRLHEEIGLLKKNVSELQNSEERYALAIQASNDGIWDWNFDTGECNVSPRWKEMLGFDADEEIDPVAEWHDRLHPDDRRAVLAVKEDYLAGRISDYSPEYRLLGKDGSCRWILTKGLAIRHDDGTVFRFVGANTDITEQKLAEDALRKSEALFRTVLEMLPVGVWVTDRDGKIFLVNKAGEDIWEGKKLVGPDGFHEYKAWWADSGKRVTNDEWAVSRVIARGEATIGDLIDIESFNAIRKTILNSAVPLRNADNEIIAVIAVSEDVTAYRQAAAELRVSHEQLRSLSAHMETVREKERTYIAREIHDELGQLLTGLKFDLSWLRSRFPSGKCQLRTKIDDMIGLAGDTIRTVQRISQELRPRLLYDLGLAAAIEWHAKEFQERTGIACEVVTNPEDLTVDAGRSTAMFRIFQETLTNVLRHAEASRVEVVLVMKLKSLQLHVMDNGKGITGEQIADPASVGLIGIKERAYFFGGKATISGKIGKGTTVNVTIPMNGKECQS